MGVGVILVLLAASAVYNLSRETGPSAEFEAMHSPEAAIAACRSGIETELSDQEAEAAGAMAAEYLGGGEYDVAGAVIVSERGVRIRAAVLCEVRFTREHGWRVRDVELSG